MRDLDREYRNILTQKRNAKLRVEGQIKNMKEAVDYLNKIRDEELEILLAMVKKDEEC